MDLAGFVLWRTLDVVAPIKSALRGYQRRGNGLLPPISREDFLSDIPRPVLEIGPFGRPALKDAAFFDIADQAELRIRAVDDPDMDPEDCPFIHYVSPSGDLSIVDRKFPAVFSSHVIEHQPDLIRHLNGVAALLEPGGAYFLIIPDKRYCFDHFTPESTLEEVIAAKGRTNHSEQSIARKHARTHNDPARHWLGLHGRRGRSDPAEEMERVRSGYFPGDVHAWHFTPASFRSLIAGLHEWGEIELRPSEIHDTEVLDLEFMAVLRR